MSGERPSCPDFVDEVDALALGQCAEPRRTALLRHAASCDGCSALLHELASVADRLLELAPQVDPPPGFEGRAVERMTPPRARRRQAWRLAAVAAAVLAAATVGALVAAALVDGDEGDARVRRGDIVAGNGEEVGVAELQLADVPRVVLTMDGPSRWSGTWSCELLVPGAGWVEVGRWTADEVSNHVWATGIEPSQRDATAMQIRNDAGEVIARASLSGPG